MKLSLFITLACLCTSALWAGTPAEEVTAAAKKLSEGGNYSWTVASKAPEGGENRGRGGSSEGKADKGVVCVTMKWGDREFLSATKNGRTISKRDDVWQTEEERRAGSGQEGGGRRGGDRRAGRSPAEEATELVKQVKELKVDGDALVGELTEEATKARMSWGRGPRREGEGEGQAPPAPTGAKVNVKFWLKDGALAKYEVATSGKIEFNGETRSLDRTSTTEIKDVGTTKLDLPEGALKKLDAAPAVVLPTEAKKPDAPKAP